MVLLSVQGQSLHGLTLAEMLSRVGEDPYDAARRGVFSQQRSTRDLPNRALLPRTMPLLRRKKKGGDGSASPPKNTSVIAVSSADAQGWSAPSPLPSAGSLVGGTSMAMAPSTASGANIRRHKTHDSLPARGLSDQL